MKRTLKCFMSSIRPPLLFLSPSYLLFPSPCLLHPLLLLSFLLLSLLFPLYSHPPFLSSLYRLSLSPALLSFPTPFFSHPSFSPPALLFLSYLLYPPPVHNATPLLSLISPLPPCFPSMSSGRI